MPKHIIKNKDLIFLWLGHLISHSGDAVFAIALPWLILEMTGSKIQAALVSTSAYLPALIFGLFAGVIVDKYNRKGIMIFSDVMRCFLVMIIPVTLIFDFFSPLLIGIVTFLIAFCTTLFYPARDCLIPQIVSSRDLPTANSSMVISGQISHLLGPLFAGVGLAFFGLTHLFTIDAISFLFSIVMISFIANPKQMKYDGKYISQLQGIKECFNYLKQKNGMGILLLLTFINNIFIMGPAYIGLAVFVKEILNGDIIIFAFLETSMAAGMIIGSFIFSIIVKYLKLVNILFIGIVVDGLTFSLLFFVNSNFFSILVLLLHGIGIPLIILSRTTLIQKIVPNELRGRFFAMIYMSVMGTTAISIAITGLVLEFIEANILFLLIGICASSCMLIGLYSSKFMCLEQNVN